MRDSDLKTRVRLDLWLWAARFFKTRRLAVEAIKAGHISMGSVAAKPSRELRIGDEMSIKKGSVTFSVKVLDLDDKRGPATRAQQLYEETPESIATRERQRQLQRLGALTTPHPHNRPDKRDRKRLADLKRN